MANLTVVIDDDVLLRAQRRALDEGTSVDALVREQLEAYAGDDDNAAAAAMRHFLEFAAASEAGSGPEGRTWTRDDLYDRPVLRDRT